MKLVLKRAFWLLATLGKERIRVALNRECHDGHPDAATLKDAIFLGKIVDFITLVSAKIEGRVTKKHF